MEMDRLFRAMVEQDASDLFLKVGNTPFLRIHGKLLPIGQERLSTEEISDFVLDLMGPERRQQFHAQREMNFAFERAGIGRFRANVLWQKGTIAIVVRRIERSIPNFMELNLPGEILARLMHEQHGLILITGPTGSGKSTTVAAMLDYINQSIPKHIVTLEDPVEFHFEEDKAIINQREIGSDTRSFSEGLKSVLRQSPDLLYLSDIRDREAMESCLLAAEAGQLVLSCIHTTNVVTTIERLVAFFPPHQHAMIRLRLSLTLRAIISLRLLARADSAGRIPVCEIMVTTPTIRDLVREGQTDQISHIMHEGQHDGMQTFTQALYARYRSGDVDLEEALRYADSPQDLQIAIRDIRPTKDVQ